MAGGMMRNTWVFGVLGVNKRGRGPAEPALCLAERKRRDLVLLTAHHIKIKVPCC